MKTLCVYCTRSGLTEKLALEAAAKTDAETVKITDGKDRSGGWGYFCAAVAGLRRKLPELLPFETALPLSAYDRVILAAPIWSENVCPLLRRFLADHGKELTGRVYLLITHMSDQPYAKKIERLNDLLGKAPDGVLSVSTVGDHEAETAAFLETL